MKRHTHLCILLLVFGISMLSGCAQFSTRSSASQPIANLIKHSKDSRQASDKQSLVFPASVAIIFVPSKKYEIPETALHQAGELLKQQLLASPKYVRSVALISAGDVRAKFSLRQIRAMYDADIAIILTYRQDQRIQQNGPGGFVDATLVGAFLIPTAKISTSTMVDGMVVHIPSNAIIFRQDGKANDLSHSTSYGVRAAAEDDSIKGLLAAANDFGDNLTKTLGRFDKFDMSQAVSLSVIEGEGDKNAENATTGNWNKVDSFKFGGAGSIGIWSLLPMLAFTWVVRCRYKQRFDVYGERCHTMGGNLDNMEREEEI